MESPTALIAHDHFIREVQVYYRKTNSRHFQVTCEQDVATFVRSVLTDNSREHCVALYLDASNRVGCYSLISIGTATMSLITPREIFQRAILAGSVSVILAHNHPSGDLTQSAADVETTSRLRKAGELLGIRLLDHVIVTDDSSISVIAP